MQFSNKILFIDNKKKNYKLKLTILISIILIWSCTITSTIIYKKLTTPIPMSSQNFNSLISSSDELIFTTIKEKIGDSLPQELSYISNICLVNYEYIKSNIIHAPITLNLNFPTGEMQCFATIEIKYTYKQGWYINNIINIKTNDFSPLFSAGDIFLDILTDAVYFKGGFVFNDKNYNYTKSYVDYLYVLTEEGDLNSTKVELASYNPDATHVYGVLSYDFDKGTWNLIDFYASWERP
ncbi:MAG: hypothetical protein KHZ99_13945 [Clostridium sp.]|uniref:hypothetical protein n=1 Tax=Clostridium sp. TaxID=1506 RepID=UPI0025BC349A|nr:hypothetical protein [Clostridium sp.]MBS4958133.1 hypothetical protein [Clostridium sp.]